MIFNEYNYKLVQVNILGKYRKFTILKIVRLPGEYTIKGELLTVVEKNPGAESIYPRIKHTGRLSLYKLKIARAKRRQIAGLVYFF